MSLSCILDQGRAITCTVTGGIKRTWNGTWSSNASYSFGANNVITGVTSASTVYLFDVDAEYNGLTQNGVYNRPNGTTLQESIVSMKLLHFDDELRNLAIAISRAPLVTIMESNLGDFYIAGVEAPGRASSTTLGTGVLMDDMNGGTFEITYRSPNGVFLLDGSLIGSDIPVG